MESTSGNLVSNGKVILEEKRQPCEQWSRCMGYYRSVSAWNTGKVAEFNETSHSEE